MKLAYFVERNKMSLDSIFKKEGIFKHRDVIETLIKFQGMILFFQNTSLAPRLSNICFD